MTTTTGAQLTFASLRATLAKVEKVLDLMLAASRLSLRPDLRNAATNYSSRVRGLLWYEDVYRQLLARADDWLAVKSKSSPIAGSLETPSRPAGLTWTGSAANAYAAVTASQITAVAQVDAVCDKAVQALTWAAEAINDFAKQCDALATRLLAVMLAALGAGFASAETVVGPAAALCTIIFEIVMWDRDQRRLEAATRSWINVHVRTLLTQAVDLSAFPNGHWPPAVTDAYAPPERVHSGH